jgi:hypothetical protein
MDVGIRYGDGRWPDLKSTFLLRDNSELTAIPKLRRSRIGSAPKRRQA